MKLKLEDEGVNWPFNPLTLGIYGKEMRNPAYISFKMCCR